jgi:glycosyltransferase involved in cell wall biosynthesis
MTAGPLELSVVVCSRDGARTLPTTLWHVERQSLQRSRYEVIVVDDGSSDRTSDVARSHGARVVRLDPSSGLAAARNAGVSAARGPVVAFTDDDCEPDEDWLAALASSFSDPEVDGVGGRVLPACARPFLLRYLTAHNPLTPLRADLLASTSRRYRLALYLRGALLDEPELAVGAPLYSAVGANMAFRRELIIELGGFDEAFRFGGEEEDLCRRAHSRTEGFRLSYNPTASVVHRFAPSVRDALRRARAYGRGSARGSLKDREVQPIVYPFPLLVATAGLAGILTRSDRALALATLAPLLTYARWPGHAFRSRSLEPLAYPYLQLAEEAATMVGELEGRRAGYEPLPSSHLSATSSAEAIRLATSARSAPV